MRNINEKEKFKKFKKTGKIIDYLEYVNVKTKNKGIQKNDIARGDNIKDQ